MFEAFIVGGILAAIFVIPAAIDFVANLTWPSPTKHLEVKDGKMCEANLLGDAARDDLRELRADVAATRAAVEEILTALKENRKRDLQLAEPICVFE